MWNKYKVLSPRLSPHRQRLSVSVRVLAVSLFFLMNGFVGVRAEEPAARAERFDSLVEALNATSERRSRVLETIYGELRGSNGPEMHALLQEALSRGNTLILQGAVEGLAMLGDGGDVPALEALLATSSRLEVKTLIIRLLPAFYMGSMERARLAYIRYAAGYQRVAEPALLAPLRRPPFTRRGRLDPELERLQTRIAAIIAGQADPVGAALAYLDHRLYGAAARDAVQHFIGNALGGDFRHWRAIWQVERGNVRPAAPDELEEIRLQLLQALADMGAEARPEVLAALRSLLNDRDGLFLAQAVFDALTVMCGAAFSSLESAAAMTFGPADAAAGESWRDRRRKSAADAVVFAASSALAVMERDVEAGVFIAAAGCLGAALAYPAILPDPESALAIVRDDGIAALERLLFMPGLTSEKRAAVAAALGGIGSERAVAAIMSILDSPYCSPEYGLDGAKMAEASVAGLFNAATGTHDGGAAARRELLALLSDPREFPAVRADAPPVGLPHMVLWRLQRRARSNEISFAADFWRDRLGW